MFIKYLASCVLVVTMFITASGQDRKNSAHDYRLALMFNLSAYQLVDSDNISSYSTASTNTSGSFALRYFLPVHDEAKLGIGLKHSNMFTDVESSATNLRIDDAWLEVPISLHYDLSDGRGVVDTHAGVGIAFSTLLSREKFVKQTIDVPQNQLSSVEAFGYSKLGLFVDYHLSFDVSSSSFTPIVGLALSTDLTTFGESDVLNYPAMHRTAEIYFGFAF